MYKKRLTLFIELAEGAAYVTGAADSATIIKAIEEAGYEYVAE